MPFTDRARDVGGRLADEFQIAQRGIVGRSSPSRVRCAASRPGRLRADSGDVAVYEGKGMSRRPPAQISECARLIRASSSIAGTGLMSVSSPRDN